MQFQAIQSPVISSSNNFFPLQSQKSKQLPSYTGLVNKCLKIISILTTENIAKLLKYNNSDPLQLLNTMIDYIYQLIKKNDQSSVQLSQIQQMLQKQQNLNRSLIKKELQSYEQHKSIIGQLCEERTKNAKLIQHISKLNQQIKDKQLAILHVKNELKACQKQRKILDNAKAQLLNQKKFASHLSNQLHKEPAKLTLNNTMHKRRKSEETGRKIQKGDTKKKQKDKQKQKEAKKSLIAMHRMLGLK